MITPVYIPFGIPIESIFLGSILLYNLKYYIICGSGHTKFAIKMHLLLISFILM
jgi:hypothetical protein